MKKGAVRTQDLVCPHCGKSPGDAFEILWAGPDRRGVEQGVTKCGTCKGPLLMRRKTRVTYFISKHEPKQERKTG